MRKQNHDVCLLTKLRNQSTRRIDGVQNLDALARGRVAPGAFRDQPEHRDARPLHRQDLVWLHQRFFRVGVHDVGADHWKARHLNQLLPAGAGIVELMVAVRGDGVANRIHGCHVCLAAILYREGRTVMEIPCIHQPRRAETLL
jgi:hypothetical protein